MSKYEIIKFNTKLIGTTMKYGYRISLEDYNWKEINNYLCDNFGEGNRLDNFTIANNDEWVLHELKNKQTILLNSLDKLEKFRKDFNLQVVIDNSQTIESIVFEVIFNFLHEPINQKLINKIRDRLSKKLFIKPFDISIDKMIQVIKIDLGDRMVKVKIN